MAAAPSGRDSQPPVYLPASCRKDDIHNTYKQSCEEEDDVCVWLTLLKKHLEGVFTTYQNIDTKNWYMSKMWEF